MTTGFLNSVTLPENLPAIDHYRVVNSDLLSLREGTYVAHDTNNTIFIQVQPACFVHVTMI